MTEPTAVGLEQPGARWRALVDVCGLADRQLDAVRVLLVTDVLRRTVTELSGGEVLTTVIESDSAEIRGGGIDTAARLLGIQEPSFRRTSPADTTAGPPVALTVTLERAGPTDGAVRRTLRVAPVTPPRRGADLADVLDPHEPLSLRLALLRHPYSRPATLSVARLHRAEETLGRWRFKVAGWRDMPSAPGQGLAAMRDALTRDVDTGTVLRRLHRLEIDPGIPSGSKFATFVTLDHVLGLDLSRHFGKPRR